MLRSLIRLVREIRNDLKKIKSERRRRDAAIAQVIANAGAYVGGEIGPIIRLCGEPDVTSSFDFGDWVAIWETRGGPAMHVFIQRDVCVRIDRK